MAYYYPKQEDIQILYQKNKKLSIVFQLLNNKMQVVDVLQGDIISGSYTIDSASDIRRVLDVVFYVKNKSYYANETSKIWIDKIVNVQLGFENNFSKKIQWYPLGLFIFTNYSFQYDNSTNTLSLNCVDFMANFTGLRKGHLSGLKTKIPRNSIIKEVIIATITTLGNIKKYIVEEDTDELKRKLPYDLEFGTNVSVYDILVKIRDIYPGKQFYFDCDGTFIYSAVPTGKNEQAILDNSVIKNLIVSENISSNFNDIKNAIQVFGKNDVNAMVKLVKAKPTQAEPNTHYKINSDSPFTIEKIGEVLNVFSGGEYGIITSADLCRQRGEYELWLATNRQTALSLSMIIIPFLNVNQKIKYKINTADTEEEYMTKSISFDFESCLATVNLNKFYPLYEWL